MSNNSSHCKGTDLYLDAYRENMYFFRGKKKYSYSMVKFTDRMDKSWRTWRWGCGHEGFDRVGNKAQMPVLPGEFCA